MQAPAMHLTGPLITNPVGFPGDSSEFVAKKSVRTPFLKMVIHFSAASPPIEPKLLTAVGEHLRIHGDSTVVSLQDAHVVCGVSADSVNRQQVINGQPSDSRRVTPKEEPDGAFLKGSNPVPRLSATLQFGFISRRHLRWRRENPFPDLAHERADHPHGVPPRRVDRADRLAKVLEERRTSKKTPPSAFKDLGDRTRQALRHSKGFRVVPIKHQAATHDIADRFVIPDVGIRPSDTWFGPTTSEGEPCYASKTVCRLRVEDVPLRPHRCLTKVTLRNRADDSLSLDRLKLPVNALALCMPIRTTDSGRRT